jgi:hypothetical protein
LYNAKIITSNGTVLNLGFEHGIVFDITPLSGTDIDVSTSQSFQQIGESVENSSVLGLTREIYGVIINDEKVTQEKLFKVFSAFSSGRLYVGDRYCDFVTNKTPYISREKNGRLTFMTAIFCPYPFWLDEKLSEFVFGGISPAFSFPVIYDNHRYSTRKPIEATNCYNKGNVKQTMEIEFSTFASSSGFGLRDDTTGKFVKINQDISGDEKVIVRQENGELKVDFVREGKKTNIIGKLADRSTLFELQTGNNVLTPFAYEGIENLNVYVKFNPAYTGVIV